VGRVSFDPGELMREITAGAVLPNGQDPDELDPKRHLLGLRPVGDIAAEVDTMGEPAFTFEGVWPSDAYGVLAAMFKAGKTWMTLDAAVSVASGTPWLGTFPTGVTGSVALFVGEGGKRKMTRRGRAVAAGRGIVWDELPIVLAERVPRLSDDAQINALKLELANHPVELVIIDPLYLAAAGAKGTAIYDMATVFEPVQVACQDAGAALIVAHHNNRDRTREGADRMSGAGPAEWGRVLLSVDVRGYTCDQVTGRTDATLKLTFVGDEIPGGDYLIRRTVWADDPNDLGSKLNYSARPLVGAERDAWDGPNACMAAVLALFAPLPLGDELSTKRVGEGLRSIGQHFRDGVIRDALDQLVGDGTVTRRDGPRKAKLYALAEANDGSTEPNP
jgi:hypothetical protein